VLVGLEVSPLLQMVPSPCDITSSSVPVRVHIYQSHWIRAPTDPNTLTSSAKVPFVVLAGAAPPQAGAGDVMFVAECLLLTCLSPTSLRREGEMAEEEE
jgi:hypothetical protein